MAGNGGKREGAGRKKGIPNKKTVEAVEACQESGLTPVEFMLSVMRDVANDAPVRMDAAHKVAPYIHAKLANKDPDGLEDDETYVGDVEMVLYDDTEEEV
jgi:hypothetical protein